MNSYVSVEPWPGMAAAQSFLNMLVKYPEEQDLAMPVPFVDWEELAAWLVRQDLGALAYAAVGSSWPALTRHLQGDVYSAKAENQLHCDVIREIDQLLAQLNIQAVWLKGAALANTIYPESWQRIMSDIDIWLLPESVENVVTALQEVGYQVGRSRDARPQALQKMSYGEIKLTHVDRQWGLVELHWGPLAGWWILRSAQIDIDGMWLRKKPLPRIPGGYQLETNDMVLQVAVHLAINHHFCAGALRNLVDIARLARYRGVDWEVVAERARAWRVGTAVYTVLHLLDQLIGVADLDVALTTLRPASWRVRAIRRFVTPERVLAGHDLSSGRQRFLLLLLLVDRKRDMVKLAGRTLWPEPEWLAARYGRSVSHWRHLWYLLRQRAV